MSSHCNRWAGWALVALVACGDTTVEPREREAPPEPGIGEVTSDQVLALCDAHVAAVLDVAGARGYCLRLAVGAGASPQQCKVMLAECIPAHTGMRDVCVEGGFAGDHVLAGLLDPAAATDGAGDPLSGCPVPASEVGACVDDLGDFIAAITCDDLGQPLTLPSCVVAVDGVCPGLLTAEEDVPGEGSARTRAARGDGQPVAGSGGPTDGDRASCGAPFSDAQCNGCLQDACCSQASDCEDDAACLCAVECAEAGIEGMARCARVCNVDQLPQSFLDLRDCLQVRCADACL